MPRLERVLRDFCTAILLLLCTLIIQRTLI